MSVNVSSSVSYEFTFLDSSGEVVVHESQLEAIDSFKSATIGRVNGQVYATYYFQNATTQTLSSGQHFTVDPATETITGPDSTESYLGGGSGGADATDGSFS